MTTPAIGRIHQRALFRQLSQTPFRGAKGPVRAAFVLPEPQTSFPLVGYAISRRCGSAVVRNRLRRRMRAAAAAAAPELRCGAYLVSSRPEAVSLGYEELAAAVRCALIRAAAAEATS